MARYDWIRAVASYMGSGYYLDLSRTVFPPLGVCDDDNRAQHDRRMQPLVDYDVSQQLSKLADRPLFVWHGERDDIVPFTESTRLRDDLLQRGVTTQLEFVGDANAEHKIPMKAAEAGVRFFRHQL
jgi:uncharacterized protein